jgi:DNA polymerase-1
MTDQNQKRLLLVDGSSYLFRAYHALPPLTTSRGEPTGAIRGVINMLQKTLQDTQPDYVGIVFDAKGKTFRDDLYPEYKANRPSMPEDLGVQIEPIHEFVRAMGLPLLMVPGVEADDVIGTLALQAQSHGMKTIISTGDKDMAQLVNDDISLINTMSNTRMDEAGVAEKFGVRPDQIIDYLALIGDSSDNVPGVPKVGPKTAVKWLDQYGTLAAIMADAENFSGKIGENLRASLAFLPLSRELVTIKTDVELDETPEMLTRAELDLSTLQSLVERFEFSGGVSQFTRDQGSSEVVVETPASKENDYQAVLNKQDFEHWMKRLQQSSVFAFDTETDNLDYMQARIVGVSFAINEHEAAYVPIGHDYPGAPQQLDRDWVLQQLKPLLEDDALPKIGQHIKYDMDVLGNVGIELRGVRYDTMLESYVYNSVATRHDMDSLAKKYLGEDTIHFEDVAGKGAKQLTFNQVPVETAVPYAAEDADITLRLHNTLSARLGKDQKLQRVLDEIEIPLIPVLSRMERTGVLIDADLLHEQSQQLSERMLKLEQQAHDEARQTFNLGSPKQLQQVLFEELKLPVVKKTPKGQPSTAEDVLQELANNYELPRLILEFRSLSKLKSTYTDKLPLQVDKDTGRVHTSYHQAVAATGRLSSTSPNLQNIPIRTEEGRRIRQAFIAPPGHVLLAADYSQIELRIMAHLSQDEGLLEAFRRGEDVHRATAAEVFGMALDEVGTHERRAAKAINFGLIYGMSAFGLAKQLSIGRNEAQEYVDAYFEKYPGVLGFMDRIRKQAAEDGYVETLYGRRLYLPEINARNGMRRQAAERTAINAPMQGTAADIIKRAMIAVHGWIERDQPPVRMIMQVHDELVFEVESSIVDEMSQIINGFMSSAAELSLPLVVGIGIGKNWDEAH